MAGEQYPQAPREFRIYAVGLFERILCEEAAATIQEILEHEKDSFVRGNLGIAAASQFDDRLVPLALEVLAENPADRERGEIRDRLVAFSYLSGWNLPEREEWEQRIDAMDDEDERFGGFPQPGDAVVEATLERGSQAGRNALCPCGSGKKYKRCCLGNQPGE